MLQQSPDALLAAATRIHKLHSTVGPQPSTINGGIPLQQRSFSRPSTAAPTTHTATDAKTSTASPENPLQRLLSNHPSKAISHPQTQSSPLWSDHATFSSDFNAYLSETLYIYTTTATAYVHAKGAILASCYARCRSLCA